MCTFPREQFALLMGVKLDNTGLPLRLREGILCDLHKELSVTQPQV